MKRQELENIANDFYSQALSEKETDPEQATEDFTLAWAHYRHTENKRKMAWCINHLRSLGLSGQQLKERLNQSYCTASFCMAKEESLKEDPEREYVRRVVESL